MMHDSPKPSQEGGMIQSHWTSGAPKPSTWFRSQGACDDVRAHLDWKAGPRVAGHMATPETTSAGRQDPVLLDTWRHVGAHIGWKVGPGATGHMAGLEPTSAGRQDPVLLDMWQRMGARLIPCLDLKLVYRGIWSVGY
jgi:hypothetical protein